MYTNPLDALNDQALAARGLPELAYIHNDGHLPGNTSVVAVKRGESGYYPIHSRLTAAELNQISGVTPAQAQAMLSGSMFGWHVPLANPNIYDAQGTLVSDWKQRLAATHRE